MMSAYCGSSCGFCGRCTAAWEQEKGSMNTNVYEDKVRTRARETYIRTMMSAEQTYYDKVLTSVNQARHEIRASVDQTYDKALASANQAHREAMASAQQTFEETIMSAQQAYDETLESARKHEPFDDPLCECCGEPAGEGKALCSVCLLQAGQIPCAWCGRAYPTTEYDPYCCLLCAIQAQQDLESDNDETIS